PTVEKLNDDEFEQIMKNYAATIISDDIVFDDLEREEKNTDLEDSNIINLTSIDNENLDIRNTINLDYALHKDDSNIVTNQEIIDHGDSNFDIDSIISLK
ncbi:17408_t:CDS:2, partial [Acaulospora morrowiae]